MRTRDYRFRTLPHALRRPGLTLDNVPLVPGNLLPFKRQYQQVANNLPLGSMLILLPPPNTRASKTLQATAALLKAKGRQVTTLPAEQFA